MELNRMIRSSQTCLKKKKERRWADVEIRTDGGVSRSKVCVIAWGQVPHPVEQKRELRNEPLCYGTLINDKDTVTNQWENIT